VVKEVEAFTFRDAYLTSGEDTLGSFSGRTHHNAVRLKSGDVIPLPLIARPLPPDHMKVDIKENYVLAPR